MNVKLHKIVIRMSRMAIYAMIICQSVIMVMASETSAQRKYLQDIFIELHLGDSQENLKLKELIEYVESSSDFRFAYAKADIRNMTIQLSPGEWNLLNLFKEVSKQTQLNFNRVNESVALIPMGKDITSPVEDLILDQFQIRGKITDDDGEPLPGATVQEKGTTNGTITDIDGTYSLSIPENAVVVVSFVGFGSQEVSVGGRSVIDVTLSQDISALDEVVVIGYGTMKKSDLTGAISSVSGEDLKETRVGNVLDQAQGRLAGVDIVRNNGSPGSPLQIRIRGNRSISAGNDPLYVIDGIPTTQDINDFSPSDIESIEVLKDASAVAIYGSRGANGVILITTKRGKTGKGQIEYNGYYGVKNAIENMDIMNADQFVQYVRVANGLSKTDNSNDAAILGGQALLDSYSAGVDTDWLDLVLDPGAQQEHQVSFSGGNAGMRYYLSGSYFNEEGVIRNTAYERFSLKANVDGNVNDRINIGFSITGTTDTRDQMSNGPMSRSMRYVPIVEPYDADGNIIAFPNPNEGLQTTPILEYVPNQYVDNTKGYRFFSNVYAEYKILEGLTYRLNLGTDYKNSRRGRYNGDYDGSASTASIENERIFAYTIENLLTYDKQINNHSINVVGLFSTQNQNTVESDLNGRGIPIGRFTYNNMGSAAEITGIDSDYLEWGLLSYMARLNYSYNDRYLFTLTGRADGSSRLAEGNKWSFFPAVSLGWIVSEEEFLNSSALSFLKLRAGYGEVGNTAVDPFRTWGGLARTVYAFGDAGAFGFGQSEISNPNLGWEVSKTVNIGLDFGLWDDRFSGTFEFYNTLTEDLLLERFLPSTSGYSSVLENVGSTRNRGWELTLNYTILKNSSGLNWDVSMNIFSNREEIVELFNGEDDDVGNQWFIGHPIDVFYNFQFDGIYQTEDATEAAAAGLAPGDIRIADVNGRDANGFLTNQPDGTINNDDRTILGSTVPDWSGGLSSRLSYKGINFSILVYTRQGQMVNSSLHDVAGNSWEGRYNNMNFNYWTPENPSNEIPIPRQGNQPLYASALRFRDGSFVKVKNITLGYDLTNSLIQTDKISSMEIYFSALNPLIFAEYDLVDPETANGNVGVNNPLSTKTYMVGIKARF